MTLRDQFIQAAANMENALTNVLNNQATSTSYDLERLLKLIIKKEIVLEFLIEQFPTPCVTTTFENTTPIIIPAEGTNGPAAPYPSTIDVSGLTGAVEKVTVTFNDLSHTFPEDISALLVGPNGQNTLLMSSAGNGGDINNLTLTFDDDAATELPKDEQLVSGTFQPTNYGFQPFPAPAPAPTGNTDLSIYNNTDPNGTWSLFINDQATEDTGTMAGGWEISITTCE